MRIWALKCLCHVSIHSVEYITSVTNKLVSASSRPRRPSRSVQFQTETPTVAPHSSSALQAPTEQGGGSDAPGVGGGGGGGGERGSYQIGLLSQGHMYRNQAGWMDGWMDVCAPVCQHVYLHVCTCVLKHFFKTRSCI